MSENVHQPLPDSEDPENLNKSFLCPVPESNYEKILLAHGGGGSLMHRLLKNVIFKNFSNEILEQGNDSAILNLPGSKVAFTTDSYVVNPVFFPGGNIGELAVYGTVNDLSVSGAKPLYISCGFIIEEGFSVEELEKICASMMRAAKKCGVNIVTGDTKVVNKGKGDKIFINTSGIGVLYDNANISCSNISAGDKIILSGSIAEHGIAIISSREEINLRSGIISDIAPLNSLVSDILNVSSEIKMMRDPTRGGVASTLNEIAASSKKGIYILEENIPLREDVAGACELFGFDPLYVANEGKLIAVVSEKDSEKILRAARKNEFGKNAAIIGEVTESDAGMVYMKTVIGSTRIIDMISGEQLPRIC